MKAKVNTSAATKETYPVLLVEVGTEEIPARFLSEALIKLKESFEKLSLEYRLPSLSLKTYTTPRRLTLMAEVCPLQEAIEKEVWGPPVTAAFDKDGNPTKAAEAFARTHGLNVNALDRKEKGKGSYLVAMLREEARKAQEILPELVVKLILSLNFPKSMRWGNSNLRFVRPIHWILATYGNKRVPLEIDGIKSIATTRGHRFLAPASFEVRDNRTYINLLRNNYVIADPEERRKIILDGSRSLATSVQATLREDNDLLEHVTFLVEYPTPVLGTFPAGYLSLPKELLITVMRGHQKYFALEDDSGKLINYFVIVSNTKKDNRDTIKKGAEKVIKARFEDARFYYEEDRKIKLKDRLEGLKKVVQHDKLGTVYEKAQRMAALAEFLAEAQCPAKRKDAHTAALLAKADLISGVVREFPELQGIMGGYYAVNEGYHEEIAAALSEHYLPASSGGQLPVTDIGAVVSLADKLDNIASFFMLGLSPTGSEDPFALRRQALGVIAILVDRKYNLLLPDLFNKALQPFKVKNKAAIIEDIMRFFEQRMEPLFQAAGYPVDIISSVEDFCKSHPLHTLRERMNALQQFKKGPEYASFLLALKRVNNIAPKDEGLSVNSDLFAEEEEKNLHKEVQRIAPHIQKLVDDSRYLDAVGRLLTLKEPINCFFDKVLVMDKDKSVKLNRLSLLKSIQFLARQIADFSKLS
jgi:glycyl-tRNA synthetase beta chain